MNHDELLNLDRQHLWHPYSNSLPNNPLFAVKSAKGCQLTLADDRQLIDGMASWWSAIHGYNNPALNQAIKQQLPKMAHVMFGGLTHEPAITLAKKLVEMTPHGLNRVFLADSGSVSVEVALKMAQQYWIAQNKPNKSKFLSFEGAYHGDTFGAMSVCDPHNGMHSLFADRLAKNIYASKPAPALGNRWEKHYINDTARLIEKHHQTLAAVILEPIAQGAGGMYFYTAEFLSQLKQLCEKYDVLFIADEIATGFGRTGKLFACEHASITPDIMCLGKALTGGYMTLAATLCTDEIANTISHSDVGALMHGPTFMGNPLACAVSNASLDLLTNNNWQQQVTNIENQLKDELLPLNNLDGVTESRVLGAIGVVELAEPVNMQKLQPFLVDQGLWLRPFGKLLYTMPPYIIKPTELSVITSGIAAAIEFHTQRL